MFTCSTVYTVTSYYIAIEGLPVVYYTDTDTRNIHSIYTNILIYFFEYTKHMFSLIPQITKYVDFVFNFYVQVPIFTINRSSQNSLLTTCFCNFLLRHFPRAITRTKLLHLRTGAGRIFSNLWNTHDATVSHHGRTSNLCFVTRELWTK